MDILKQIDEFVAYSADAKTLNEQIEACKQSEAYSLVEGDLSYNRGDYGLERQYNESVNYNRQRVRELESQLENVNKSLIEARNGLKRMTEKLSYNDIHYAIQSVKVRVEQLTSHIDRLKDRLKEAFTKGDKAYQMGDYKAEREYNQEYTRILSEIKNLEPVIASYNDAISYLSCREMTINESEQGLGK